MNKFVTIDRVISKLIRDLGLDSIATGDVIEWTGEALDAIGAVTALEEKIAFLQVSDYKANLPMGWDSVIQIARNNEWQEETKEEITPGTVLEESCPEYDPDCKCQTARYIPVDETGTPLFEKDLYEWKPTIWVAADYIGVFGSTNFQQKWTPVRPTPNSFFEAGICELEDAEGLYQNSKDEYRLREGGQIQTSFKDGYIAVAYLGQVIDEQGFPKVPDEYSYMTAILKYITLKMMERFWYMGRENYKLRMEKAESDWQWYCRQAATKALMPKGVEDLQDLVDQQNYLIPRQHRYRSFFADQNTREGRKFNNPDGRVKRGYNGGYY